MPCSGWAVPLCQRGPLRTELWLKHSWLRARASHPGAGSTDANTRADIWDCRPAPALQGFVVAPSTSCGGKLWWGKSLCASVMPHVSHLGLVPWSCGLAGQTRSPASMRSKAGLRGAAWGEADPQGHEGVMGQAGAGGWEEQRGVSQCPMQGCCLVTRLPPVRGSFVCHSIYIFSAL